MGVTAALYHSNKERRELGSCQWKEGSFVGFGSLLEGACACPAASRFPRCSKDGAAFCCAVLLQLHCPSQPEGLDAVDKLGRGPLDHQQWLQNFQICKGLWEADAMPSPFSQDASGTHTQVQENGCPYAWGGQVRRVKAVAKTSEAIFQIQSFNNIHRQHQLNCPGFLVSKGTADDIQIGFQCMVHS